MATFLVAEPGLDPPRPTSKFAHTTLADIIERDTDTTVVQDDAFHAADRHSSDEAPEDPAAQLVIGVNRRRRTISRRTGG